MRSVLNGLILLMCFCTSLTQAALVARDLDGNFSNGHEGVYDTVLNITWLANANLAATETFGVEGIIPEAGPGRMKWSTANSWIAAMNTGAGYLGINSWRLPTATPLDGSSFYNLSSALDGSSDVGFQLSAPVHPTYNPVGQSSGATNSELAYHFYNNFAGIGQFWKTETGATATTDGLTSGVYGAPDPKNNKVLFSNLLTAGRYWTGSTVYDGSIITFDLSSGDQYKTSYEPTYIYAWAVTGGDVGVAIVPLPPSLLLYLFSIAGLMYCSIKKSNT